MTNNLDDALRELSEIYDSESNDTYVSLYLKKGSDNKFLDRRKKAINSILKDGEKENFSETISEIEDAINQVIGKNVAIFASNKHKFLRIISLPIEVENLLVVDSSPYLRPLARIQDEWESFTLVLVSTNSSKIFSVSLGKIDATKKLSADIMNKHKKGGWSQARFNRIRRGAINAFLKEVVEELEKIADKQIIIAGPGNAKNQLLDMLPKHLSEKVIELIDISIDDENRTIKESLHLISEQENRKSSEAVQHLKSEILKEGLAVYGVDETLRAVRNGQVELLIIQKDFRPKGWICENCQIVKEGSESVCPNCGKKTSEVDVLEEILEFAKRTDAEIEFTDDEEIANLGHVGGILRYK
jgi:peptide chain release factor subunit 1